MEHGAFGVRPALVGVGVRTVGDQARDDDEGCVAEQVAAPQPAGDLLGRETVTGQVGGPLRGHRVEQALLRGTGLDEDEPPGRGVVRRRGGDRSGDSAPNRRRIHRLRGEPTYRSPGRHRLPPTLGQRLGGTEGEHVLLGGTQQGTDTGGVVHRSQPADDRRRNAGQLALHQVRRGGDLVGHGDLGDRQHVSVRIADAAQVGEGCHSGEADRVVDHAGPPGPAGGVGDDDGDLDAERHAQPTAQRIGRDVRVDRQQGELVTADVRRIDSGGRDDEAVPRLDDLRAPPGRDDPHRLRVDDPLALGFPFLRVRRRPDQPALDLRHRLRGHHDDVPVDDPRRRLGDQCGEVPTRPQLRDAGDRPDLDPVGGSGGLAHATRSSVARAMAMVASRSVISSGTSRTVTPGTVLPASVVSTSQPSSSPPVMRAP